MDAATVAGLRSAAALGRLGHPNGCDGPRVVALLSQTARAFDPLSLKVQKAAVDAAARAACVSIDAYVIELAASWEPWGRAVRDLLLRAHGGGLDAVVVDSVDRLASDRDAAMLAAVTLAEHGVRLVEARPNRGPPTSALDRRRIRRRHRGASEVAS